MNLPQLCQCHSCGEHFISKDICPRCNSADTVNYYKEAMQYLNDKDAPKFEPHRKHIQALNVVIQGLQKEREEMKTKMEGSNVK